MTLHLFDDTKLLHGPSLYITTISPPTFAFITSISSALVWYFDSFLWPAVEEFLTLVLGTRAYDALLHELFLLRAHLILIGGDIPAISMVMRMKGHNGLSPCRMCKIKGLRIPNSRTTTHYVPLDRQRHPDVINAPAETTIAKYDPADLPLRQHNEILEMGRQVQHASTNAEAERLAKEYGVKGVPILSFI